MKIPDDITIVLTPIRPVPYTDEEMGQVARFINTLPVDPPLPKAELRVLDGCLQQLIHNRNQPPSPDHPFAIAELTDAVRERFGAKAGHFEINEQTATQLMHAIFADCPTIQFRQFQLNLEHDHQDRARLRVGFHPVEWRRVKQFAWRLAGMTFEEESGNEHQPSAAA
jgi:hypothetical protein